MRHEQSLPTKHKVVSLMLLSILAFGALWFVVVWPSLALISGLVVSKWMIWIVAYFAAQLVVGIVIGRAIRGPE